MKGTRITLAGTAFMMAAVVSGSGVRPESGVADGAFTRERTLDLGDLARFF